MSTKKHLHPISVPTKKIPELTQTWEKRVCIEKVGEFYYHRYQAIIFLVKPTHSHTPRLPNTQPSNVRRYIFGPQKPTYQNQPPSSSYDSYDWKTRVKTMVMFLLLFLLHSLPWCLIATKTSEHHDHGNLKTSSFGKLFQR